MLQFVILLHHVESTVDANPQKSGVRIAVIMGSPLNKTQRWSLSIATQCRTLHCFLVGGHPMFFRIDRTENVDPWLSFNTQFNSFASSNCTAVVASPVVSSPDCPVRLNTQLSLHVHPIWDLSCEHFGECPF